MAALSSKEKSELVDLDKRLETIENRITKMYALVRGIAIGIGIGALAFGWITIKDLIGIVK